MDLNDDYMSLLMVSNTLCARYNELDEQTIKALDINTNETCKILKIKYPDADDKAIQCITLSFLLYMYATIMKITN
jgi:hypothetical protein